jgi:hypothetical protein
MQAASVADEVLIQLGENVHMYIRTRAKPMIIVNLKGNAIFPRYREAKLATSPPCWSPSQRVCPHTSGPPCSLSQMLLATPQLGRVVGTIVFASVPTHNSRQLSTPTEQGPLSQRLRGRVSC